MVERKIIDIEDLTQDRYSSRSTEWIGNLPDQELLGSIRGLGLIQDVIVRPTGDKKKPYSIVAGYRRYQALLKSKAKEVPCKVLELDDLETIKTSIGENLGRKELTASEKMESINLWYHMTENPDNIKGPNVRYDKEALNPIAQVFYGGATESSRSLVVQQLRLSKLPKSFKILLKKPEERTEAESLELKEAGIEEGYVISYKILDQMGAIARKLGIDNKEKAEEAESQTLGLISELELSEKSTDKQLELLSNFSKELEEKPYSIALAAVKQSPGFGIKESISISWNLPAKYLTWHKRIMEEGHVKSNAEVVRRVYLDYLDAEAARRGWI